MAGPGFTRASGGGTGAGTDHQIRSGGLETMTGPRIAARTRVQQGENPAARHVVIA